ncbi:MAG: exodeoxyribonuclease VII small subunit [Candidatus Omnitrophica bacterium]|nr:exodeoxyribonuclease VII small subunit [Candidatus Omnitrophota bacterium]MDD5771229.1 exodeoxyribonuclease VII small subunit [Candidatus Omnitrophota bacterium]
MKEKPEFEDDLKKLQKIVEELSSGKLTLGESLKRYEEGVRIAQSCASILTEAERKVELLMKKEGKFSSENFGDEVPSEDK